MKFVRYGNQGEEKPGIIDSEGQLRDLSEAVTDISGDFLTQIDNFDLSGIGDLPIVDGNPRLGPCVGDVGKIICIGLNYSDHAEETGMEVPSEPIVFMKATSSLCGPNDDLIIPRNSEKTDWEVELGIVIGKPGKYISEEDALSHVAGYCVVNDVSERGFQIEHMGQWTKGKSCDTFAPAGPYLVRKNDIPDPHKLALWVEVNGNRYQDGTTSTMVYGVEFLISYLSQFMSLQPGDIISTGTPPGVGMGMKPPVYLKPGDIIKTGIEGLGEQHQTAVADQ